MRVTAYESLDELPPGCEPLFEEAGISSFFLTHEWYRNLAAHALPEDCRLRVYVADEGGKVLGVLPMKHGSRHSGPFKGRRLEALANYYSSFFMPLAASGECLQAIVNEIVRERWDIVDLHPMPQDAPVFKEVSSAMKDAGMSVQQYYCFGNWYLDVAGRSYSEYSGSLPSRLKHTLQRKGKQLSAIASRVEIIKGKEGLEQAIAAYQKVYRSSWKMDEPYSEFMPGLIRLCAERGWLRLGLAYKEEEPIAAQLWIVKDGIASIYKLAYDEKFSKLSAGSILTAKLMEHVIDVDHVREVDYLTGDEDYKKDWMAHRRERWGLYGCNMRTPYGLCRAILSQTYAYAKRIVGNLEPIQTKEKSRVNDTDRMKWKLYPIDEFERHRDAWQRLNREALLEADFILPALKVFGSGNELLAVYGDEPCAMAILVPKGRAGWETFQPTQAPIGAWLQKDGMDLQQLLSSLLKSLPGFPLIFGLTQQDPDLLPRPSEEPDLKTLDYIDTARITVAGSFDEYWQLRGKNLRHNMKKQRNNLEKLGIVTRLEQVTTPEGVAQAIADYGRIESASWKAEGGTAIHPDNDQGRFYREMLEAFCQRGAGRIYRYWYNDCIAAMDLCIEGNGSIIILKTTYDESVSHGTSPAFLMRQDSFRQIFDEGRLKRIEFYGKLMEWHTKWSEEVRTMYHVNCFRWSILPSLRRFV